MAKNYSIIVKTVISYMITELRIGEWKNQKTLSKTGWCYIGNSDIYASKYVIV